MKRLNFPEEELAEKRDKLLAALEARAAEIVEEELAATDGHAGAGPISMGGGPGTSGLTYDEFDGATYRVVAGPDPRPRVLLANFTARIKREIDRIEDGKSSLKYEITAARPGRLGGHTGRLGRQVRPDGMARVGSAASSWS